jgi:predicted ATP-grasp superfamily ATP-dependent carboligase
MESQLSSKIETDEYYYFFTLLFDRFNPLNERWQHGLEQRFKKPFKPIYVLPFRHNSLFAEENYIVLNKGLKQLHKKLHRKNVISLIYPEELNKQFSESSVIKKLIQKLVKKQDKVFVLGFTSVWLNIDNPNVVILGPDSKVAGVYDDKAEHIKTFEKLGLPTNKTIVYPSFDQLRRDQVEYPFFLSATFSSGGIESRAIYTPEDLEVYYAGLRPVNKRSPFIAAHLLDDIIHAPNTSALVHGRNKTTVVCVSDQILRSNQYMGNIYPTQISQHKQALVKQMTITVGNYLSRQGFRGLFGMDFLITSHGQCYPVDLNPRRQGGYYCNAMMTSRVDLIDLELRVIFGEKLPKFEYKDFQVSYCWAHSKLMPYFSNMKILNELREGEPTEPFTKIGATHKAIYYPKDHVLLLGNPGFYLATGRSYSNLKLRLFKQTEITISTSYELYEG